MIDGNSMLSEKLVTLKQQTITGGIRWSIKEGSSHLRTFNGKFGTNSSIRFTAFPTDPILASDGSILYRGEEVYKNLVLMSDVKIFKCQLVTGMAARILADLVSAIEDHITMSSIQGMFNLK
jgi:hypothetical protein